MEDVARSITPSKQEAERLKKASTTFLSIFQGSLGVDIPAQAFVGGSVAKGTWLSGSCDVDVFVAFEYASYKEKSAQLSDLLEPYLRKAFVGREIVRLHGSRDYFQIEHEGYNFEVVPILKIARAQDALNITDVSLLHVAWVLEKGQAITGEIRLAKQFCKAQELYGAESYISGFSGYVLEILVIFYGSFEALLRAARLWKAQSVVDAERHYPKKDALFHLNSSKTHSPLVVIDPVDKDRNAAAALSLERFTFFKKKAAEYLKKPSSTFFEKKIMKIEDLQAKAGRKPLVAITVVVPTGKKDVVGVKVVKVFHFLEKELASFGLKEAGWRWEGTSTASFYFILNKRSVAKIQTSFGPPLGLGAFVDEFKRKHTNTFVENGRIVARIPVLEPELSGFVKELVKKKYVTERIKTVETVLIV